MTSAAMLTLLARDAANAPSELISQQKLQAMGVLMGKRYNIERTLVNIRQAGQDTPDAAV